MPAEAFFLSMGNGRRGQRFCLWHRAGTAPARGAVLYVHPFAEEMNKSRRMAALQARALAQDGYGVLQIDLLGCGDSSDDFGDATWQEWIDDIVEACTWLRQREGAPLWLWGLRAGCLLAADAARQLDAPCNFVFWQPATSGKVLLQQFLRLKVASDMLAGKSKGVMDELRRHLADGAPVDVAGYTLSAGLADGFERATLRPPLPTAGERVEWIELSGSADAGLAPASAQSVQGWQEAGFAVRSHVVAGPAFWQTTEIEEAPELIAATLSALAETVAA